MQQPKAQLPVVARFKVVFIGDQAVGKTSIISRFVFENFPGTHQPTIGIDFISKMITVNNKQIRLQLWDTAGQERFRSLIPSYIRDANAAIICYDVTNQDSFTNILRWLDYVKEERGSDVITVLIGNKIDMVKDRVVSSDIVQEFVKNHELHYFEVSAKEGTNIANMFKSLSNLLVNPSNDTQEDKATDSPKLDIPHPTISLSKQTPAQSTDKGRCAC